MQERLQVTIPDKNSFYSLYSDGLLSRKTYFAESRSTVIEYAPGSVVALYYTYPARREACLARFCPEGPQAALPGLSQKVRLLFSVGASRVDKLKRAIGFLQANCGGAFSFDDGFYIRLCFILRQRGKLNIIALRGLAGASGENHAHTLRKAIRG